MQQQNDVQQSATTCDLQSGYHPLCNSSYWWSSSISKVAVTFLDICAMVSYTPVSRRLSHDNDQWSCVVLQSIRTMLQHCDKCTMVRYQYLVLVIPSHNKSAMLCDALKLFYINRRCSRDVFTTGNASLIVTTSREHCKNDLLNDLMRTYCAPVEIHKRTYRDLVTTRSRLLAIVDNRMTKHWRPHRQQFALLREASR